MNFKFMSLVGLINLRKRARTLFLVLILIFCISFFYSLYLEIQNKPFYLEVAFLDVGQGDAIFITTPSGKQVLIDGGPDASVLHGLGQVMPWWDRTIDVVIASHPDKDHIAGLVDVLTRYRVERVVDFMIPTFVSPSDNSENLGGGGSGAAEQPSETYLAYTKAREDSTHHNVHTGELDMGDGVVLHLLTFEDEEKEESSNNKSLMAFIEYENSTFVLTGDIDFSIEKKLVDYVQDHNPELLNNKDHVIFKASHHGSKTGSSQEILQFIQPQYTIYSAGKDNRFGHPHDDVKKRVVSVGSIGLCTCNLGHIVFQVYNNEVYVNTSEG